MKKTNAKHISFLAFSAMIIMYPAAVSANGNAELVKEQAFNLVDINTISISYSSGKVIFLEGQEGQLSFKEYLNSGNEKHFAQASASGGKLDIERGSRPLFRHLRARLEVYLPPSFAGSYRIRLGSGSLEADTNINAEAVNINISSGTLRLRKVNAENIRLRAASGSIHAAGLYGKTDIELSSGSLFLDALTGGEHGVHLSSGSAKISGVSGKGNFSASSGNITLEAAELSGNLSFELSSGSLNFTLPKDAAFNLDAETSSGSVNVNSGGDTYTVKGRSSILRPIGENPEFTIFARLSSGNITINRR
jgi:hypothetical protein